MWLAAVLLFSGGAFGAARTGGLLKAIFAALRIELPPDVFAAVHFAARKSAHVVAYGTLSLLWFRAWRGGRAGWRTQWAGLALAVCLMAASADETRQAFTPGRGGSKWDVALDMSGALLAQLVIRMRARQ